MKKWLALVLLIIFGASAVFYLLHSGQSSYSAAQLQMTYSAPQVQQSPVGPTAEAVQPTQVDPSLPAGETEPAEPTQAETGTVTISIAGSEGDVETEWHGGETVLIVTQRVMGDSPIWDFDYGADGKWRYTINGEEPEDTASKQAVKDGDHIQWLPNIEGYGESEPQQHITMPDAP